MHENWGRFRCERRAEMQVRVMAWLEHRPPALIAPSSAVAQHGEKIVVGRCFGWSTQSPRRSRCARVANHRGRLPRNFDRVHLIPSPCRCQSSVPGRLGLVDAADHDFRLGDRRRGCRSVRYANSERGFHLLDRRFMLRGCPTPPSRTASYTLPLWRRRASSVLVAWAA